MITKNLQAKSRSVLFAMSLTLCCIAVTASGAEWLPITPEELSMTAEPKASGAPAIILYRQIDRDDVDSTQSVYLRIKVLSEEGRRYADVELPYRKGKESIRSIEARTIRPDGSIVKFDGTIYDKPLIKKRSEKLMSKTFTMPDVQVGSIIEYRYRFFMNEAYVYDSQWVLSADLFTKLGKFSLKPNNYFNMTYSWPVGLPPGATTPVRQGADVRMEVRDVAAFEEEDYSPPEMQLKYHVDFIYTSSVSLEKDPILYWKKFGKDMHRKIEAFVDKRRAMEEALTQIVAPGDSPDIKLRKIYARTQQVRNISFERQKTEQESKREAIKDATNVADVWKRGYGTAYDITWLFLGLTRAAGFDAHAVLVSTRDVYFFNDRLMNPNHLNTNVVLIKLDGKDLYFDPGVALAPFGVLPWEETAVRGLTLDKNGGTWITTPFPSADSSTIERKAELRLSTNGTLEGKIVVTYTGLEALWRRQTERNDDEADRKEFLENQLKSDIPTGIDVKLTNQPDWTNSATPLVAEYELRVPGWASGAGQRLLMPVGLFGGGERGIFKQARRVHPLYFNYPATSSDDIQITLPDGWQASSVPSPRTEQQEVVGYKSSAEQKDNVLRLRRELMLHLLLVEKKYYASLRDFFQQVRAGDEEQIVLVPAKVNSRR